MDPQTTLNSLLSAILAEDREATSLHASDLLEWLNNGGFSPRVDKGGLQILLSAILLSIEP